MTKEKDWQKFTQCIKGAATLLRQPAPAKATIAIYFDLLREYDLAEVQAAMRAHLTGGEGKFWPTPSHLIAQIEGSANERAEYAWRYFINALDRYGYYDSVRFPEPAYHYAIEMFGGWVAVSEAFGDLSEKELTFKRGEFVTLFIRGEKQASFETEDGKKKVRSYLPGWHEQDNQMRGYSAALPPIIDVETGRKIPRSQFILGAGSERAPQTAAALVGQLAAGKRLTA